jgi:hypothetical protein
MRRLVNKTNVEAPDSDYLYGRIKDNPGNNTGTPVNELVYGDMHQFFERLFALSGLTENELPDNAYSGWQLMQALGNLTMYKQTSVSSLVIGTGSKTFTIDADGHAYTVGMYLKAVDQANAGNYMKGYVSSITDTTIIVSVDTIVGSGTIAAWNINIGAVEDTGWVLLTPENNWAAFSTIEPAYRKIGNIVYLRGVMRANGDESSVTMATLPVGARPIYATNFPAMYTPAATAWGLVIINTVGTIAANSFGSAYTLTDTVDINLSGLSFVIN